MNTPLGIEEFAKDRAETVRRALARHRLVFVQVGIVLAPTKAALLENIGGTLFDAERPNDFVERQFDSYPVVVDHLETSLRPSALVHLGSWRKSIMELLESDPRAQICLISAVPTLAYGDLPGSSLLTDAKSVRLALLESEELPAGVPAEHTFPCVAFGTEADIRTVLEMALIEIGPGARTALDYALFESTGADGPSLDIKDPRVVDALIGSGLVRKGDDDIPALVVPKRAAFREALSSVISRQTQPTDEILRVFGHVWEIERTLRAALRKAAEENWGSTWRRKVVNGNLANELVERANTDGLINATTISTLRDPTEWLTLSELVDIICSKTFDGLGIANHLWLRFRNDLVRIRNRLMHMRFVTPTDEQLAQTWRHFMTSKFEREI